MDEATLQRIMTAAMQAANANATAQVQSLRKPELPQFDKSNIKIWIKRVESAYARVRVTDPKLKFAHLESKFDVNSDPIINDFLFKTDATADTWTSFLGYLRERYGRTTKQEAVSVINSTPREGRTPSQLVALMKEKAGGVTLDDMLKEQLLKELPADVCPSVGPSVHWSVRPSLRPSRLAKPSKFASIEASSIISNRIYIHLNRFIIVIVLTVVIIITIVITFIIIIIAIVAMQSVFILQRGR